MPFRLQFNLDKAAFGEERTRVEESRHILETISEQGQRGRDEAAIGTATETASARGASWADDLFVAVDRRSFFPDAVVLQRKGDWRTHCLQGERKAPARARASTRG